MSGVPNLFGRESVDEVRQESPEGRIFNRLGDLQSMGLSTDLDVQEVINGSSCIWRSSAADVARQVKPATVSHQPLQLSGFLLISVVAI